MKHFLIFLSFLLFLAFNLEAQNLTTRNSASGDHYTGKRFDTYGKALKKQNQKKGKNKDDVFLGEYSRKSYPIGMGKDKNKKKRKSNYKGKKKKKGCNCPGH